MAKALTPMESAQMDRADGDQSKRFLVDQQLRAAGYAIHERRAGREAKWMKAGVTFTQSEALYRLKVPE